MDASLCFNGVGSTEDRDPDRGDGPSKKARDPEDRDHIYEYEVPVSCRTYVPRHILKIALQLFARRRGHPLHPTNVICWWGPLRSSENNRQSMMHWMQSAANTSPLCDGLSGGIILFHICPRPAGKLPSSPLKQPPTDETCFSGTGFLPEESVFAAPLRCKVQSKRGIWTEAYLSYRRSGECVGQEYSYCKDHHSISILIGFCINYRRINHFYIL